MTTALAPEGKQETKDAAAKRLRRFESTYRCGFHQTGDGTHCRGAVRNGRLGILRCSAYTGPARCLDCGSTENVNEEEWRCVDGAECRAAIAKKQSENRTHQQLMSIRAGIAADTARRDRTANQIRRDLRAAVERGETIVVLNANGEEEELTEGSWLLEDSFDAPLPPKKAKTGECRCCGEATRGGKFLPGHDAKLKSSLKKAIKQGTPEEAEAARLRLKEEGWEAVIAA